MDNAIECGSEEGVTIGLIDSLMSITYALQGRDLTHPAIIEALKDLRHNKQLKALLYDARQEAWELYDKKKRFELCEKFGEMR